MRGKGRGDPLCVTAGNFMRAAPLSVALSLLLMFNKTSLDATGVLYALASGALASALGYAVWYTVLPGLKATKAAVVQLSVPVLASLGGIVFLGEPVTLRLTAASAAILGGIALAILDRQRLAGDRIAVADRS